MNRNAVYRRLRKEWEGLVAEDPRAWDQRRAHCFSLIKSDQLDDGLAMLSECPPLMATLFDEEEGWLTISRALRDSKALDDYNMVFVFQYADFMERLHRASLSHPVLSEAFHHGAFDRLVFEVFDGLDSLDEDASRLLEACSLRMLRVPAGQFRMGERCSDHLEASPVHRVTITQDFRINAYPCTQALYLSVMGEDHLGRLESAPDPVHNVSWYDAIRFCNRLSERDGLSPAYHIPEVVDSLSEALDYRDEDQCIIDEESSGIIWHPTASGYRLPTEAEWEYVAKLASQEASTTGHAQPPARTAADFGLADLGEDSWEWVFDSALRAYEGDVADPVHVDHETHEHIYRGGRPDPRVGDPHEAHNARIFMRRSDVGSLRSPSGTFRIVRNGS